VPVQTWNRRLGIRVSDDAPLRHGIAFLCAVTEEDLFERLARSIDELERPEGVAVETFAIRGKMSLTHAHNLLMEQARDYKYKVYVHQDVTFLNTALIADLLAIFRRRTIGLLGTAGARFLGPSFVWWEGSGQFGKVLERYPDDARLLDFEEIEGPYQLVEGLDGHFLATQYDVPWDEAIPGAEFYEIAQCTRFMLAGYEVVVPRQAEPWCFHDHTPNAERNWVPYYEARDVFAARYGARRDRFVRSRVRRRLRRGATRLQLALGHP
jgi:glycosyl transferase family 2